MRKTLVFATAVTALAFAAGCGGGDESSASPTVEWADGFCTAITSWTDAFQRVGDQFADPSSLSQAGLETATGDIRAATEQLVDDLKSLGAPETESGQAAKESIDELATTLENELADIEDTVQGASGLTEVPEAIASITAALSSMSTAFGSTLQTLESGDTKGELQSALEQAPACSAITSSSGG